MRTSVDTTAKFGTMSLENITWAVTKDIRDMTKNIESLVVNSAGISIEQFNNYKASDNYYNDLKEQYDFLISNQGPSPCKRFQYKVVNDFNEMVQWVDQSVNHILSQQQIHGKSTLLHFQATQLVLSPMIQTNL